MEGLSGKLRGWYAGRNTCCPPIWTQLIGADPARDIFERYFAHVVEACGEFAKNLLVNLGRNVDAARLGRDSSLAAT